MEIRAARNPTENRLTIFASALLLWFSSDRAAAGWPWSLVSVDAPESLTDVAFGAERFVATGEAGSIFFSDDAQFWSVAETGDGSSFHGVAHGGSEFIAVGADGKISRSADGEHWIGEASPTSDILSGAAYGAGRWVAVGGARQGTSSTVVVNSGSTTIWVAADAGTQSFLSDVAYGAGVFVAVGLGGAIIRSADGLDWSVSDSGSSRYFSGIEYLDGQFVVVGQRGSVLTSTDGVEWNSMSLGVGWWLFDAGKVGDNYVVVGESGGIFTSSDLAIWTQANPITSMDFFGFAHGVSTLVAVGGAEKSPVVAGSPAVVLPESTFVGWQCAKFDASQLADPLFSSPSADPDGDGLPNAVEWSHALDPLGADQLPLWSVGFAEGSGAVSLAVEYEQSKARPLVVSLVASDDLNAWVDAGFDASVSSDGEVTQVLRFSEVVGQGSSGDRRFYRLRFELP